MGDDRPPADRHHRQRSLRSDGSGGRARYQQLRDEGVLYQKLVNTIQDPIVVADTDQRIIDCNQAFTDRFGHSLDEVDGQRTDILYADPEEFDAVAEELVVNTDDPTFTRVITYETRSGESFPGETNVVTFRDDTGEIIAFIGLIRDITEQKEREREREKTIEFLQSLYDVATDRTVDVNEKITRLLELGPEKLNLPEGYLTRIDVSDTDSQDGTQRVIKASGNHELLQPGNSCPLAKSYCRKTITRTGLFEVHNAIEAGWEGDPAYELFNLGCYIGTTITVDNELYGTVFFASESPREGPFSDAERTFVRLMSRLVGYELERDQARRELEQQNERLEEFAGIISHDLRNPLSIAQGRLELAREEDDNEHLESVARAHGRMVGLIDDLLTLAREGHDTTDVGSVHLEGCVEACWRNVETADAALVTAETDRTIKADRSQLQQLLENLYRNAVEHGGHDVTITIGTVEDGFYVEDDGPGVPEDERDEVFKAGYSTSEEGTGFGLNIVKQIVEAHDWEIRLTDGSEGGARFEITGVEFAAE